MSILHISHLSQLASLVNQTEPFTCLLSDDCPCDSSHFQNTSCRGIALVGKGSCAIRRGKHLVELELSRQYGCPVRLFKNEKTAQDWLDKQMQSATH